MSSNGFLGEFFHQKSNFPLKIPSSIRFRYPCLLSNMFLPLLSNMFLLLPSNMFQRDKLKSDVTVTFHSPLCILVIIIFEFPSFRTYPQRISLICGQKKSLPIQLFRATTCRPPVSHDNLSPLRFTMRLQRVLDYQTLN